MTTDELRAKFETWWEENYFYVHEKLASLKEYAWMGWQAAHASRDAEVEALRYGLSEAREGWHQANGVADLAIQHRDAAEAEVDALRKDAERYRWLRDAEPTKRWNDEIDTLDRESGHEVDAAIDAAMREEE